MEQKMEYMIITISDSSGNVTTINHFAQQGWIVICSLGNSKLIMGREVK
jgi:hypothetical protein